VIEETAQTLREQSLAEPPVIIGSCLGAVFALEMLQRKVISSQRLVIVDPLIFFPMYLRVFLLGKFGEGAYRASMETGIGRIMANLISRINRSSDVDMTASLKDIDHDSAYCYLKLMTDLPNPQRYSDLELAVDIIYGEETFRFARKSSKALKAIWEHAHEYQVPKASHLPIIEQTEFTAQLIFGDDTVGQTGTANLSSAQPDTTGASTARPVRSV
jgi:pimeloyl-ACP methyl ester carboxylesterase